MSNVIPLHGPRRSPRLAAGRLFVERYRLRKQLGRGGMGEVWAAWDEKIGRTVALKVLHPRALQQPGARARFERESQLLSTLKSERMVTLYDWGTEPQPFIVMQRIEGVTLRELLRELGPLPWRVVVCYALEIAEGLSAMHDAKLWHRDVKPENLMVSEDGHVKILDLGIACDAGGRRGTITDRLGTRGYLPPEMILGRPTDHRRDLYALGVVLYELLTGQRPFGDADEGSDTDVQAAHLYDAPDPILARAPQCPEALEALVLRLLEKDPARRYGSARRLVLDLGRILSKMPSLPPGEDVGQLVARALARRKLEQMMGVLDEEVHDTEEDVHDAEEDVHYTEEVPVTCPVPVASLAEGAALPRGSRIRGSYPAAAMPEGYVRPAAPPVVPEPAAGAARPLWPAVAIAVAVATAGTVAALAAVRALDVAPETVEQQPPSLRVK